MEKKSTIKTKLKNFWNFFTTYEKIWFISIITASLILTIFYPDEMLEDGNLGVFLIILCLVDIIASCTCELLLSKQCKWNFIVSIIGIEITECIIFFSLGYYASATVSLLFWIPIDIISFIKWNEFKDNENKQLTQVKKLNWWQDILILIAIAGFACLWGFLISPNIEAWLDGSDITHLDANYFIDAIAAGMGIANGVFILLRIREQWIAWFMFTILEAYLWIVSGMYIMLILTAGYLTNTVYGFVKWTKYIKHKENEDLKSKSINGINGIEKENGDELVVKVQDNVSEENVDSTNNKDENNEIIIEENSNNDSKNNKD